MRDVSLADFNYLGVGWPGSTISENNVEQVRTILRRDFNSYPVFVSQSVMESFYSGFCNKTIWPLFHYFPSHAVYDEEQWNAYEKVNEIYCQEVQPLVEPGDIVWVPDYHLMFFPGLIRERRKDLTVAFFLPISFPSYERFRLLPRRWQTKILEGLLGADLIGFHTHDYTLHFLKCVLSIMGFEHSMKRIILEDRMIKAETIPMGINFQKFSDMASSSELDREKKLLRKSFSDLKVVLSVNRLDYTKGILNRLEGYETFLAPNPSLHGKVTLMMVVVPSRLGVEHYRMMKRQIDE